MLNELPAPSKRSFGFPLPVRALDYFVHPGGVPKTELFTAPFSHAGSVFACNGFLALRVDRFDGLPPAENPDAFERIAKRFHTGFASYADHVADCKARGMISLTRGEWEKRWRPFDDCALALWKRGPLCPFDFYHGQWRLRRDPMVWVGAGGVAPLPLLQLLARLPRSQVWIDNTAARPIICRFNGGMAVMAPIVGNPPVFSILSPKRDLFTDQPVF